MRKNKNEEYGQEEFGQEQQADRQNVRTESKKKNASRTKKKKKPSRNRAVKIAGASLVIFFILFIVIGTNSSTIASIFGMENRGFLDQANLESKKNEKLNAKKQLYEDYFDIESMFSNRDVLNILLFGMDSNASREGRYSVFRPDTIMVITLNFSDNTISVVSVPRDTYTKIYGISAKDKINASFMHGNKGSTDAERFTNGVNVLKRTVEDILGITIHQYVGVDMDGVRDIIDTIGGVETDVERDISVGTQRIRKGVQVLNGRSFMAYARYRSYPDGDIARVRVQQRLFKDLFRAVVSPSNYMHVPQLATMVKDMIATDLDFDHITSLAINMKRFDLSGISTDTLPGNFGNLNSTSYWIINQARLVTFVKEKYGITIAQKAQDPLSDALKSLSASVSPSTLRVGDTASLSITGEHADGSTKRYSASDCTVTSSDPSKVRVSGSNVVAAAPTGGTVITIARGGKQCQVTVIVREAAVPETPPPPVQPPVQPPEDDNGGGDDGGEEEPGE